MHDLINDKIHLVIEMFHSLPHLDMWFVLSNSTFDPNSSDYLETILFWTTVPILTLILILLILILYACCLVCISNSASIKLHQSFQVNSKRLNLCKFKTVIWIFVILLCLLLGLIVFGSEHFHYSFNNVTSHVNNFSAHFVKIGNQTRHTQESIQVYINTTFVKFESDFRKSNYSNTPHRLDEVMREIKSIKASLHESYNSLANLRNFDNEKSSYSQMIQQAQLFETTRWTIMVTTVVINMLLIVLLITGLIRDSKGSLCFFAFTGVLSLITIWILNAIYLGITVFLADYCVSPNEYIKRFAEHKPAQNLVFYYTTCPTTFNNGKAIPTFFKLDLNRADSKLRTAIVLYTDNLVRMSRSFLGDDLIKSYGFTNSVWETERLLDSLRLMTKCDEPSVHYKAAVKVLCTDSIFSLAIIVVSGILFGLIMPILICIIPQMWRRMHNKAYYKYNAGGPSINIDESHPFIPLTSGVRSNISAAARQFNESPSFQRLVTTSIQSQQANTNQNLTIGRNRYNSSTIARTSNNNNNNNANLYATTTMNRVEDYVVNTDPYLMYGNKGLPSAPPPSNYAQSNYASAGHNNTSMNVPIVLYPNSNGTRTLSNRQYSNNNETLMRNQKMNNYHMS